MHLVCMCRSTIMHMYMDMYYYVLHVVNLVAMYMINVVNKFN